MKICSKCKIEKPVIEFSRNRSMKDGLAHYCKACAKIRNDINNKQIDYKCYYQTNKEKLTKKRQIAATKGYFSEYRSRNLQKLREADRKRKAANRPHYAALNALRDARKKNATPAWVNLERIESFYREAYQRTLETGVRWSVDHIIPLSSSVVCGLHVPANLQLLTLEANIRKGNRF